MSRTIFFLPEASIFFTCSRKALLSSPRTTRPSSPTTAMPSTSCTFILSATVQSPSVGLQALDRENLPGAIGPPLPYASSIIIRAGHIIAASGATQLAFVSFQAFRTDGAEARRIFDLLLSPRFGAGIMMHVLRDALT